MSSVCTGYLEVAGGDIYSVVIFVLVSQASVSDESATAQRICCNSWAVRDGAFVSFYSSLFSELVIADGRYL